MPQMTERELTLVQDLRSRMSRLVAKKDPFQRTAVEIAELLCIGREGYQGESGQKFVVGKNVYDGTPVAAHQLLTDGLTGSICSQAIDWAEFTSRDKKAMKQNAFLSYLRECEDALYDECTRSNFYEVVNEATLDASGLGTTVVSGENHDKEPRSVFTAYHFEQFYIEENRYAEVDTYLIKMLMTYRQIVQAYAPRLSETFKQKAKDKPDELTTVIQAVYPRETNGKLAKNKPYASVHFFEKGDDEGNSLLRESGFDFSKFIAWRFRHYPGCAYGGSPGINALSDIKMINLQSKTMADAAMLSVQPPMLTNEGMRGRIKIAPRAVMYRSKESDTIEPVQTIGSYPLGIDSMDRRERIIREHFKTDFFMTVTQMQKGRAERRTAYEVMEAKSESAVVLGTTVTRMTSEFLEPFVRLVIALAKEGGRWPSPPRGFEDAAIELKFTGPLAQAQRQYIEVQSNLNAFQMAAQLAAADPTVLMNFDLNYLTRRIAEAGGMDPTAFVTQFTVEDMQKAAKKRQAELEAVQVQNETAKAMSNAGKPVDPTSVAAQMGV